MTGETRSGVPVELVGEEGTGMKTELDGVLIDYWWEDGGGARLVRCSCGHQDEDGIGEVMSLDPFEQTEDAVCPACGAVYSAYPFVSAVIRRNDIMIGEV